MNSRQSAMLNAQVSTTCEPWVLINFKICPASRYTPFPCLAGIIPITPSLYSALEGSILFIVIARLTAFPMRIFYAVARSVRCAESKPDGPRATVGDVVARRQGARRHGTDVLDGRGIGQVVAEYADLIMPHRIAERRIQTLRSGNCPEGRARVIERGVEIALVRVIGVQFQRV